LYLYRRPQNGKHKTFSHDSTDEAVVKLEHENTPQRQLSKWVRGLNLQQKGLGGRGVGHWLGMCG